MDIPAERFIEAIRDDKPDVLMLSALITSTLNSMRDTVQAIQEAGLKDQVKILVGGVPVTAEFARKSAGGYAADAAGAARIALQVVVAACVKGGDP